MAATIMQEISSVFSQVTSDCSDLNFAPGDSFYWRPEDNTVYHPEITNSSDLYLLLHEIGHARSAHTGYDSSIHLLDMEREAWDHTISVLVPTYGLSIDDAKEISEDALDSYRDWIHKRSTCPTCNAIGIEVSKNRYKCLICDQQWQANEARNCQLRRYKK